MPVLSSPQQGISTMAEPANSTGNTLWVKRLIPEERLDFVATTFGRLLVRVWLEEQGVASPNTELIQVASDNAPSSDKS